MDLKEIESGVNPDIHWYYQTKKIPLFRYIEKLYKLERQKFNIIDLGAGSGFFSQELYKNYAQFINNICLVDIGYADEDIILSSRTSSEKRKEIPPNISHSLVMMMDVLEHAENDLDLLIKIKRASSGKNYFLDITEDIRLQIYKGYLQMQILILLIFIMFMEVFIPWYGYCENLKHLIPRT